MKNKLFKKIVYIFIMASQNDINKLIDIYFQQSNILYTHLFDSYNIFIIPLPSLREITSIVFNDESKEFGII